MLGTTMGDKEVGKPLECGEGLCSIEGVTY